MQKFSSCGRALEPIYLDKRGTAVIYLTSFISLSSCKLDLLFFILLFSIFFLLFPNLIIERFPKREMGPYLGTRSYCGGSNEFEFLYVLSFNCTTVGNVLFYYFFFKKVQLLRELCSNCPKSVGAEGLDDRPIYRGIMGAGLTEKVWEY